MPPKKRRATASSSTASAPAPKKPRASRAKPALRDSTPPPRTVKRSYARPGFTSSSSSSPAPVPANDDSSDDDEYGADWEDVPVTVASTTGAPTEKEQVGEDDEDDDDDEETGPLNLTLSRAAHHALPPIKKKGASMAERRVRMLTHCMHVQFLLYHGWLRNRWANDKETRGMLLSFVSPGIMAGVERWFKKVEEKEMEKEKDRRKREKRIAKGKAVAGEEEGEGDGEEDEDEGGDTTLMRVLGQLMHWFARRFTVTAPALRKGGYKSLHRFAVEKEKLDEEGEAEGGRRYLFSTGNRNADGEETFTVFRDAGEWVHGIEELRTLARELKGSRDIGAVLFTALCRALGMEARLVYSLQPLGFGFGAVEDAAEGTPKKASETPVKGKPKKPKKPKKKTKKKQVVGDDEDDTSDFRLELSSEDEISKSSKPKPPVEDKALLYPTFWTEVYSPLARGFFAVDPLVLSLVGHTPSLYAQFEPKGAKATAAKQVIAYVVAYAADSTVKDVTTRYLSKQELPGKTKGFRVPVREEPLHLWDGSVVGIHKIDWWGKVLRRYERPPEKWTDVDRREDGVLLKGKSSGGEGEEGGKKKEKRFNETLSGYKNHPEFILERHLKREEAIRPGRTHVKTFTVGKGDKKAEEKVYRREDVVVCKASENWYKEGRKICMGAQSLKQVKRRAVTLTKKREIEDARLDGETIMQGLYSLEQTELYIPPPVIDGQIVKNAFGNIDLYVPSMLPAGAVHMAIKGAVKIARKLGIDHAEAVIGFDFGSQRAVPVIHGIVVAEENEDMIRDAWREAEKERRRKEDAKTQQQALERWRKFVMKARVLKRLRDEYVDVGEGENPDEVNPFQARGAVGRALEAPGGAGGRVALPGDDTGDEKEELEELEFGGAGGFLVDGKEDWDDAERGGGGFLVADDHGGGFVSNSDDNGHQARGIILDIELDSNQVDQGVRGFVLENEDNADAKAPPTSLGQRSRVMGEKPGGHTVAGVVSLADLLAAKEQVNALFSSSRPDEVSLPLQDHLDKAGKAKVDPQAPAQQPDLDPSDIDNGESTDSGDEDSEVAMSLLKVPKAEKNKADNYIDTRINNTQRCGKAETTRLDIKRTKIKKTTGRELAQRRESPPVDVFSRDFRGDTIRGSGINRRRSARLALAPRRSGISVEIESGDDVNDDHDYGDE